jgi:MraZ protein
MFFGNYATSLDEKGRVHIPAVLAKQVGDNEIMMVSDWGQCIAAFPPASFEAMGKRLHELSRDPKLRDRVHRIVSSFFECTIKNGKLLIPQELRSLKKLEKKVSIVGMLEHIEIWNHGDWRNRETERGASGIRDDLNELGIL